MLIGEILGVGLICVGDVWIVLIGVGDIGCWEGEGWDIIVSLDSVGYEVG